MTLFNMGKKGKEDELNQPIKEEKTSTLGSRIAELRKQKGYTQEEFSQLLGVTAQAVSKWENDNSCPDIMLLPKIAQLLDTSTDELLGGATPEKQDKPESPAKENKEPADLSKLNLKIRITAEGKKPVNVSFPLTMVKRFTKLGLGISGIVNLESPSLDNNQIDNIFSLIDDGATGEIMNFVDEGGQHIVIEIS